MFDRKRKWKPLKRDTSISLSRPLRSLKRLASLAKRSTCSEPILELLPSFSRLACLAFGCSKWACSPRKFLISFLAFTAGHFQQINTLENTVVSCLFYLPLVLSVRYSNTEKFYILFKPDMATLNKRNELVSTCRPKWKFLLKVTRPSFFGGYHPTLKFSGIPIFTFIVSLTHRMDNI